MRCSHKSCKIRCEIPEDQIGRIVGAIVLPDAWMDRVLAKIHLADEVERIQQERQLAGQRLKRLGKAYVDGLYPDEDYRREKRALEEKLATLVVPGVDAAKEAGELLESLPSLWEEANLSERRKLLLSMLDAVYVDTVEEKSIVAIRPKPAFQPLFGIATARADSDVILINEPPLANDEPEAADLCFWWRRGRLQHSIPKFLVCHHSREKRHVSWLRLDANELLPVDGNSAEYFSNQRFPLLVGYP